jgi:hypothetical protein
MASHRQIDTPADLNKAYEANQIGLKGIVYFALGLFLLIVITFALMWALLNVLRDYDRENAGPVNPMQMSDKEKLPPEPRLQEAPGFGIDTEKGRLSLELTASQAEYRELRKEWTSMWEHGRKDEKTGVVTMLPIDEAKHKLLDQGLKSSTDPAGLETFERSKMYLSDASSGRVASLRRR